MQTVTNITLNIHTFADKFRAYYTDLYENYNPWDYSDEVCYFDEMMQQPHFQQFVGEFVKFRGDFISSDREAAAFFLAFYDMTHPAENLSRHLQHDDE